jgi:hypothetical protein
MLTPLWEFNANNVDLSGGPEKVLRLKVWLLISLCLLTKAIKVEFSLSAFSSLTDRLLFVFAPSVGHFEGLVKIRRLLNFKIGLTQNFSRRCKPLMSGFNLCRFRALILTILGPGPTYASLCSCRGCGFYYLHSSFHQVQCCLLLILSFLFLVLKIKWSRGFYTYLMRCKFSTEQSSWVESPRLHSLFVFCSRILCVSRHWPWFTLSCTNT